MVSSLPEIIMVIGSVPHANKAFEWLASCMHVYRLGICKAAEISHGTFTVFVMYSVHTRQIFGCMPAINGSYFIGEFHH